MKFPPLMGVEVIFLILKSYHFAAPLSREGRKKRTRPSVKWTGRPFVYGEKWRNIV
jgi:hypothetical protein